MHTLSIVIPTLNEETSLEPTLRQLLHLDPPAFEIIIVDGGSTDTTEKIARGLSVEFVTSEKTGRAAQMNLGATLATGSNICFLHADTLVPKNLTQIIDETLAKPETALAGFTSMMGQPGKTRWFTTLLNYSKTYLAPLMYNPYRCLFKGLRLLFGDQAMFCRLADFHQVGGFDDEKRIMEEADLCTKLNRLGRIRQIPQQVYTSDRRIVQLGFWRAHVIYLGIFFLWILGVSTDKLQRYYKIIR